MRAPGCAGAGSIANAIYDAVEGVQVKLSRSGWTIFDEYLNRLD